MNTYLIGDVVHPGTVRRSTKCFLKKFVKSHKWKREDINFGARQDKKHHVYSRQRQRQRGAGVCGSRLAVIMISILLFLFLSQFFFF